MIEREVAAIRSREDLSRFVGLLEQDLRENRTEWENPDLARYLEALSALIDGMAGLYRNLHRGPVPEQPTWAMVGEMLLAAKYYEWRRLLQMPMIRSRRI